mmetsp:Transcript_21958/g.19511  ORF Transcript_21958/g.19511 Transcript_21958/m.19511 type:complete len:144 (-) Transcript_21958:386-817(-)
MVSKMPSKTMKLVEILNKETNKTTKNKFVKKNILNIREDSSKSNTREISYKVKHEIKESVLGNNLKSKLMSKIHKARTLISSSHSRLRDQKKKLISRNTICYSEETKNFKNIKKVKKRSYRKLPSYKKIKRNFETNEMSIIDF